jgi:sugar phosphate isomerase/epimerase
LEHNTLRAAFLNRREWLAAIAAQQTLAAAPAALAFGVSLDGVRDADETLKAAAAAGYTEVEGSGLRATLALAPKIRQYGLAVRSCVIDPQLVTDFHPVEFEQAILGLKDAGVEYCIMGVISAGARGDGDDFFRRTADRMNAGGELCRKAGLKLAWANEGFEFEGRPGGRPIDIYRDRLDAKLVALEMDVLWVRDPVALLKDWKGRVPIVRLRDKLKDSYASIGDGQLDFAAILKAAQAAGVKHYMVYDDPDKLAKAFSYLRSKAAR